MEIVGTWSQIHFELITDILIQIIGLFVGIMRQCVCLDYLGMPCCS